MSNPAIYIPQNQTLNLGDENLDFLLNTIREYIEMDRFDYNRHPSEITDNFVEESEKLKNVTPEEIEGLLDKLVIPKILAILDVEKELRAKKLVSEEQKQQFIATKAKEAGITAHQMEAVMNSAYIYIPYIDSLSRIDTMEDDRKVHTEYVMAGGIIWYHLNNENENPEVNLLLKKETFSQQGAVAYYRYGRGNKLSPEQFAFQETAKNFARNLQVATQTIPAFQLFGELKYVEGLSVQFNLGTREGVALDDGFYVQELRQDANGQTSLENVGFIRTVKVGDNSDGILVPSFGRVVMGKSLAKGMRITEHPRLPFELASRVRMFDIVLNDTTHSMISFNAEANYHIGRFFGQPMVLGNFGASFGGGEGLGTMILYGGVGKKYYYRRIGFGIFGQLEFASIQPSSEEEYGEDGDWSVNTVGFTLHNGVEYVVTPNINIGVYGGHQFYPKASGFGKKLDHSGPVMSNC